MLTCRCLDTLLAHIISRAKVRSGMPSESMAMVVPQTQLARDIVPSGSR